MIRHEIPILLMKEVLKDRFDNFCDAFKEMLKKVRY